MDTSEYMPMFLAESREHLQELNLAVVRLEEDPSDRETIDEIFRIAHSLKGMSATMGFAAIAELTHHMEDVFELLRQRSGELGVSAVNTVLACLDALSEAVDSIEESGQERLDPVSLIDQLRRLVHSRTPEQELERAGGAELPEVSKVSAEQAEGRRILHVKVELAADVLMPAVRSYMLFVALGDYGEVIGSIPSKEGVEQFSGRVVEVWLASDLDEDIVAQAAQTVSDVAAVTVREYGETLTGASGAVVAEPPLEAPPAVSAKPSEASAAPTAQAATGEQVASGDQAPRGEAAPPPATDVAPQPAAAPVHSKSGSQTNRSVRVDAERLDALMHLMGELVIHRTAVEARTAAIDSPELDHAMQNLTRSSQALQSMVMQVRMIPVDVVFMRFPRLVRDLSTKLGKDVELELLGRDTELDRTVVDALGDPLVHLVRNSLDHGLEDSATRLAHGKSRVGRLTIAARHAGGSVVIEVRDDGRGVDPQAVARKALSQGMIDVEQAAGLDMRGALELLFAPGFSTAETTSDVSGRGVGMDAVRAKIRELGGEVLIESTLGQGTHAQIKLPLTLAIVSALQVDIAGAPFAIPLDRVERTLRLDHSNVRTVIGRRVLDLDSGVIPLLEGAATFEREPTGHHEVAVIVRGADRRIGLAVDTLVGQRELVTRPLPAIISDGQPVSGGAVLADGQIALIIDCDALVSRLSASNASSVLTTQLAA
jgi:two-component system chemotaxis sensor kinase CheA